MLGTSTKPRSRAARGGGWARSSSASGLPTGAWHQDALPVRREAKFKVVREKWNARNDRSPQRPPRAIAEGWAMLSGAPLSPFILRARPIRSNRAGRCEPPFRVRRHADGSIRRNRLCRKLAARAASMR
jgi:hypothetical protein